MVVSKTSTKRFLERPRFNSDAAKKLPDKELDRKLVRLGARFEVTPWRHQKICFLLGRKRGSYLFLVDMGGGKTKLSLDLYRYFRGEGAEGLLVVVPGTTHAEQWQDQVAIHIPECHKKTEAITHTLRQDREDAFRRGEIVCVTYQGLLSLVAEANPNKKKSKRANSWRISAKRMRALCSRFSMVVFDESSYLRRKTSLYYRLANELAKTAGHIFGLTGTPFDKDPQDLWAQFHLVDGGYSLGESLGLFRSAFCTKAQHLWHKGFEYTFDERKQKKLHRFIKHCSIYFPREEFLDVPPIVGGIDSPNGFMRVPVTFSTELWRYQEQVVKELVEAGSNKKLLKSAYHRLRSLASGWLATKVDEERVEIDFDSNPKLDALVEQLETAEGCSILVYHHYQHTGKLIADRLKPIYGNGVRQLHGKSQGKNKVVRDFKAGKYPILVCSRSVVFGLDLQVANYIFVFESPDSCIDRKQLERRIVRPGQLKHTFIYDVTVKGSIDERILASLKAGKDLFDGLVEGKGAHVRLAKLLAG